MHPSKNKIIDMRMAHPSIIVCIVLPQILFCCMFSSPAQAASLDAGRVEKFAQLALAGIDREYPNKPGEVLTGVQDLQFPRAMHPAHPARAATPYGPQRPDRPHA